MGFWSWLTGRSAPPPSQQASTARQPMVELAILVNEPLVVGVRFMQQAIEHAFGVSLTTGQGDSTEYVMGEWPIFFFQMGGRFLQVKLPARPYFDKASLPFVSGNPGLILLKSKQQGLYEAIAGHQGWIAVTFMNPSDRPESEDPYFFVAKMLGALAHGDVSAVIWPERNLIRQWDDGMAELLENGQYEQVFSGKGAEDDVPGAGIGEQQTGGTAPDEDSGVEGKPERSPSGAPIYRHQPRRREFEVAAGDEESIDQIGHHIEQFVGPVDSVFHELVSDLVHVDVHIVRPTPERNYFTLVTSGMSDRPMAAPEGSEDCRYAELVICLPPTWPLTEKDFQDEANYWPIRWLKILARLPHEYHSWLYTGHTVPNGDPPRPFADNTRLCCALLLNPVLFDDGFRTLTIHPDKTIHFLSVVPLYRQEMDFKLRCGLDPLLDRLRQAGVNELLDMDRDNVCEANEGEDE